MQFAAGSIQKSILWKHDNQSSHKKLILFISFINIWWLSHQSLLLNFCQCWISAAETVTTVQWCKVSAASPIHCDDCNLTISQWKNNVTTQRQCAFAPSATAAHKEEQCDNLSLHSGKFVKAAWIICGKHLLCLLVSSILQEGVSQKCQQIQWRNMCSGTSPHI